MNIPTNLKYAQSDEWTQVDGNVATIGISDYAQDALSDVVFVEIKVSPGDTVKANQEIASLESVKAAAYVSTPVSGKVIEVNDALSDTPETVNTDPYGKAWMVKIELADPAELDALMDPAAYESFLKERDH